MRDPEYPDLFWVNPFARSFRQMRVSDLILVNHAGEVVYGHRPVNRAAFVLHAAVHEARPDINADAHAHSPYGKAAIHQNHGLFTVGETVDAAAYWFLAMERCCQAQLLAEAAGSPQQIRPEWASFTRENTASSQAGWLNFQSFWEEISQSDPELFN